MDRAESPEKGGKVITLYCKFTELLLYAVRLEIFLITGVVTESET
jgi:hypothetical protein